ncbi:MAG: LuxR C-terminal-related transcriptional regulator [Myxococcota bacterium]|nr:LuxR C-terminal-related transcriptional regulator [Myxococcota bacterium]
MTSGSYDEPASAGDDAFIGRFLLLEDDGAIRERLRDRLEAHRPVEAAEGVSRARTLLAGELPFIGYAFDIHLDDGSGLRLLDQLRAAGSTVPAVVMTGLPMTRELVLEVGPLGRLLPKPTSPNAVDAFDQGLDAFVRDALLFERRTYGLKAALFDLSDGELTPTMMEVAVLGVRGWSREEIAKHLGISATTVRNHVSEVLDRCGLKGQSLRALRRTVEELIPDRAERE